MIKVPEKLNMLLDVHVPSPTDDDVVYWDAATGLWKAKAISAVSDVVMESDFDATTFLYATLDDTPEPKTPAEVRDILNVEDGATADQTKADIDALGLDHGSLDGSEDDDHTHYLKEEASGGLASEVPDHTHQGVTECGKLDHGLALDGLLDDDHTQYQKESEKGAASGYASLNASTKVTEQPAAITDHLEGTPTEDLATKAPTSEWAYDHYKAAISATVHQKITGAALSQTFGAGSGRLPRFVAAPLSGYAILIANIGAKSGFNADIAGNPTSTSVVYDGDTDEDFFNGLHAYDGTTRWGQIVLHNTTRGNSRKIVSVDRATNTITTTDTSDDWADNDVITIRSRTETYAYNFDLDLSAQIPTTTVALMLRVGLFINDAFTGGHVRLHPFEGHNPGKAVYVKAVLAGDSTEIYPVLPVISQKVCIDSNPAMTDSMFLISVKGYFEYADT